MKKLYYFGCTEERILKRYPDFKVLYLEFKNLHEAIEYLFKLPMPYNHVHEVKEQ